MMLTYLTRNKRGVLLRVYVEIVEEQILEGSCISQAFLEDLDGRIKFTKKREKPRRSGRGWIARRRDGSTPSKPSAYRYILPVND